MKLYLCSEGKATIERLELPSKRMLYIGNGGDLHADNSWVGVARDFFVSKGFEVIDFDLRKGDLYSKLKDFETLFVNGGNCLYLKKLFDAAISREDFEKWLSTGVYIGSSAGSCIMGTHLEPLRPMDHFEDVEGGHSLEGYGFVDCCFIPHDGREKYVPMIEEIHSKYDEDYNCVYLKDGEYMNENGEIL